MRISMTAPLLSTSYSFRSSDELLDRAYNIYHRIAGRAAQLSEARGREGGHYWEDWRTAEAEFLRPVSVTVEESFEKIVVRANVIGFAEAEIQAAVESQFVIVAGKQEPITEGNDTASAPNESFRFIDLPAEIIASQARVCLCDGMIELCLPKRRDELIESQTKNRAIADRKGLFEVPARFSGTHRYGSRGAE